MFHAIDKVFRLFGTKRDTGHIVATIPTHEPCNSTFSSTEIHDARTIFANV